MTQGISGRHQRGPARTVSTGFADLDRVLDGGLRRGQLTAVVGVTGVGTSTFALGLARSAALRQSVPALYLSPEASPSEIDCRVLAAEAPVPVGDLRAGTTSAYDQDRLRRFRSRLPATPLILSTGAGSAGPLAQTVRDHAATVGVAVVDATPAEAETVRELTLLAQQHDLVLVVTARTGLGGPPRLDELEASGLAGAADLVLGLHRDDLTAGSTRPGEADVEILKHRYGPMGRVVTVAFQGHYARFVETAR